MAVHGHTVTHCDTYPGGDVDVRARLQQSLHTGVIASLHSRQQRCGPILRNHRNGQQRWQNTMVNYNCLRATRQPPKTHQLLEVDVHAGNSKQHLDDCGVPARTGVEQRCHAVLVQKTHRSTQETWFRVEDLDFGAWVTQWMHYHTEIVGGVKRTLHWRPRSRWR